MLFCSEIRHPKKLSANNHNATLHKESARRINHPLLKWGVKNPPRLSTPKITKNTQGAQIWDYTSAFYFKRQHTNFVAD
jgi:hypothetical protein